MTRHLENLDSFRERAQILSDELGHFHAGKMNQNMYILSLIAAIFLPLTFLPSLLGVNIGGIPGADYGSAFALFCGLLFAIMLIQIWIFRRLKSVGQGAANRLAKSWIDGLIGTIRWQDLL